VAAITVKTMPNVIFLASMDNSEGFISFLVLTIRPGNTLQSLRPDGAELDGSIRSLGVATADE